MNEKNALREFRIKYKQIIESRHFKWYQRGVILVCVAIGTYMFCDSFTFYKTIGEGKEQFKKGNYSLALGSFKKAMQESKRFGLADPRYMSAVNNTAESLRMLGRYAESENLYTALVVSTGKLKRNAVEIPLALNGLAVSQRNQCKLDSALSNYKKALFYWDANIRKPGDPRRAAIINGLARVHKERGEFDSAGKLFKEALAIKKKAHGDKDVANADVLVNLGSNYREIGEYARSEQCFKRALLLDSAGKGALHPDTATDINNLAALMRLTGRYAEAAPLYKKALAIRLKRLGPAHPLTARCYNGLGAVYVEQGNLDDAVEPLSRAKEIQIKAYEGIHTDLADTLEYLGRLSEGKGDRQSALANLTASLEIRAKLLPVGHPDTGVALMHLARVNAGLKHDKLARRQIGEALDIINTALGPSHALTKEAQETKKRIESP